MAARLPVGRGGGRARRGHGILRSAALRRRRPASMRVSSSPRASSSSPSAAPRPWTCCSPPASPWPWASSAFGSSASRERFALPAAYAAHGAGHSRERTAGSAAPRPRGRWRTRGDARASDPAPRPLAAGNAGCSRGRRPLVRVGLGRPGAPLRGRLPPRPQRGPLHLDRPQPPGPLLLLPAGPPPRTLPVVGPRPRRPRPGEASREPRRRLPPRVALAPFVFFSLAGSKLPGYVLPCLAPARPADGPGRGRRSRPTRTRRRPGPAGERSPW